MAICPAVVQGHRLYYNTGGTQKPALEPGPGKEGKTCRHLARKHEWACQRRQVTITPTAPPRYKSWHALRLVRACIGGFGCGWRGPVGGGLAAGLWGAGPSPAGVHCLLPLLLVQLNPGYESRIGAALCVVASIGDEDVARARWLADPFLHPPRALEQAG